MNDRFPKDCWDKKCQHFHVRDMSIDDLRCTCDLLYGGCDASDEDFSVARCPRSDTVDQCDLCSAPYDIDEKFIFGHGEKSVFILQQFMVLSVDEATAIRYHMSSWQEGEARAAGDTFRRNPLAFFLHVADEAATFIDEVDKK